MSFAILWYGSSDYTVIAVVSAVLLGSLVAIVWVAQAQYEEDPYESYLTTVVEWVKDLFHRDGTYDSDSSSTTTKSSRDSSKRSVKAENASGNQTKPGRATNAHATRYRSSQTNASVPMHSQNEESGVASTSQV